MQNYLTVADIRNEFIRKYKAKEIVTNDTGSLSGADTIEIISASFIADEPAIFGEPNEDYIQRELEWYCSMSLNVNDIPGKTPKIWSAVASKSGMINSNYGYLAFSEGNHRQYTHVIETLIKTPSSRRATMIYTRPTMHTDFNIGGMQDFVCTNTVQYLIRDNKIDVVVQMRSCDAWAGFRNDYSWQKFMQARVADAINVQSVLPQLELGKIYWHVASLHVYEKQFYLIESAKDAHRI